MNLFEGLNDEQLRAVKHLDGPMLVVAGAGTGKTQVITRRIAHLIAAGHARPTEILALTFTEKAAGEMSARLFELIGWQSLSVRVVTFNAFGAELLGRFGGHIGRSTRGGLINDIQKMLLIRQRLDDITFEYYGLQGDIIDLIERVVAYIGRLQNAGITTSDYRRFVDGLADDSGGRHPADISEQRDLANLYELYEQIKIDTGTFDYYDQLSVPLRILRERPNLAKRLEQTYRYVLVDEYQDTSPVQDALLRQIVPSHGNIFAVGDDDQAIYGFRGADIENILRFTEHFKVERPMALIQNYRSGQPILDAAYRLIRHNNPDRLEARLKIDKKLIGQTDAGSVSYQAYRSVAAEQTSVIDVISARIDGQTQTATIAVLARSNATLRRYAKALRSRGIAYAISTTVNIFEQRELINLWYLLEWIGSKAKDEAITHVILGPYIGWSAAQLRVAVERSRSDLLTLEGALKVLADEGDEASKQIIASLGEWRDWAAALHTSELAYKLVFETGVAQKLIDRGSDDLRVLRVFDDLHRLLGQMQDFDQFETDTTLAGYLAVFPRPPELEVAETEGDADGVQLLTVHAAKGLEFKTVFVVGCTAKSWSESGGNNGGLEFPEELTEASELPPAHEQRRLMYVAVTRAKTELYLSSASETAGGQRQAISPLIEELLGAAPQALPPTEKIDKIEKSLQKLQQFYPLQAELPTRLPFERADGWIELGVGALEQYDTSPHDFYLQRVLGITQPFGPQLAFGKAIHAAIEAYYKARLVGDMPTLEELNAVLDANWSDQGYESRGIATTAHQRARATIDRFLKRETTLQRPIQASELPIIFELPEAKLRLRGRIDATIMTPDGLEIRDFKTGGSSDPEALIDKARASFQLRTYALAIEELSGTAPTYVTLDYVVTGVEGQATLSPRVLVNHRQKLVKLAERLRARDFVPGAPSLFRPSAALKYYGTEASGD